MHQKPFLSLKTSLFQVYGNIEIVEGYSSQIYSCGKQFNLLEEYSPLRTFRVTGPIEKEGFAQCIRITKDRLN